MKFDQEKFREAIIFFANNVNTLGITKLNKLLYYSDFKHVKLYGRPILGDKYVKYKQGPVPEASYSLFNANFTHQISKFLSKDIEVKNKKVGPYNQKRIIAKRESNLEVFSKSEISILQAVASKFKNSTATDLSNRAHIEKPWKETAPFEYIDYKLILDNKSVPKAYVAFREAEEILLEAALLK
jgi:uncharacterized phage-associated protein